MPTFYLTPFERVPTEDIILTDKFRYSYETIQLSRITNNILEIIRSTRKPSHKYNSIGSKINR